MKQKKSLKKLPMTGLDYNWIKRRMNFAYTQISSFTIEPKITEIWYIERNQNWGRTQGFKTKQNGQT